METVTISKEEFDALHSRSEWLGWLEAAGVDNTCAWEYAHQLREEYNAIMEE